MSVRVRMFAALREAAGTSDDEVEAGPLDELLETLCRRHGDLFRRRLAVASVLLDGSVCARGTAVEVEDGAELALLPPVSGGAA